VNAIRSKMSINVFAALSFERSVASDVRMGGNKKVYLAEGNQHALHLAEDMRRKGDVDDAVVILGWKATTIGVKILEKKIKNAMCRRKPDVVILECLDNNIYFGLLEDRGPQAAKVGTEEKEHV
jgi:hypothetical protein